MNAKSDTLSPTLITGTDTLAALCARLATESFVTVDTEFMRERTYFPELCLVQIAGASEVAVIDPMVPGLDLAPLGALLADERVTKVFHACRQDVEIFLLRFGAVPAPLFDTQIAAMVAGFGDQVGYETLVSALAQGGIDKAHRFSDWQARPLSRAQIEYAAADVTHLRVVYGKLVERLEREGRLDWVAEEMAAIADPATYRVEPEDAWKRLRLRVGSRRQLALIQAIAAWREREAARVNVPRQRLIRDEQIPEIAALAPEDAAGLTRVRGISKGFAESRSGASLLAAIAGARALPEENLPELRRGREQARPSPALVALLKVLLAECADRHNVAARLIASAEDIDQLARKETEGLACLIGWRAEVFGRDALRLVHGEVALATRGRRVDVINIKQSA